MSLCAQTNLFILFPKKFDRYSSNMMDFTSYLYTLMSIDKLEWFLCISARTCVSESSFVCVFVCSEKQPCISYTYSENISNLLVFDAISPWPWLKAAFTQYMRYLVMHTHTGRKDESKRPSFALTTSWLCAQIILKSAPLKLT